MEKSLLDSDRAKSIDCSLLEKKSKTSWYPTSFSLENLEIVTWFPGTQFTVSLGNKQAFSEVVTWN